MTTDSTVLKNFFAGSTIIGFTGPISSGCSFLAKSLSTIKKYHYYSLSAPIYEYADACIKEGYIERIDQGILQNIGNELRRENGPHYLAKVTFEQIDAECETASDYPVVIDSIRNDMEVRYLRQFPNFFLISVYSNEETRRSRWSKLNPNLSRIDFDIMNDRDASEHFEYGQQVKKCTYESDIVINNDTEIDSDNNVEIKHYVDNKLSKYIALIEDGPSIDIRPELDEKLMTIAYLESLSSSCLQRKVGAVISNQEGAIVSTGYNHVPTGEKICSDKYGECYRNYLKAKQAELIKNCPKCGRKISILCSSCEEALQGFVKNCPKCGCVTKFDYCCSNCGVQVYDTFLPGGKNTPGKLLDECRALHAEENAIVRSGKNGGVSLNDGIIYTTTFPCTLCANKIAQAGIRKVVFNEPYTMKKAQDVLSHNHIDIDKFEGVKSTAFFRLYGY